MTKIEIAYNVRVEGHEFDEIEFFDVSPEFKNISLVPKNLSIQTYEIRVHKNVQSISATELSPIFSESTMEAERFMYVFSHTANIKMFNFQCVGLYCEGEFRKYNQLFGINAGSKCNAVGKTKAGNPFVENVKKKMAKEYDLLTLQMYYDAATVVEPIGRFTSLYALLLHKYDDSQKNVDEAIASIDKTVAHFPKPTKGRKKISETIFTKLRNEISHKRDGVDMLRTHEQIKSNLMRFDRIVKELLLGEDN